ncbi:MAG: hypothetical protein LBV36_06370, partial [Chromatiales bacterium]|nr:hypothetical protein [Chromatiales bacterium]
MATDKPPAMRVFRFVLGVQPRYLSLMPQTKLADTSGPTQYAAVDLGSNSFHMIIARVHGREINLIDRLREQVRLAEGLNSTGLIDERIQHRAFECLRRFRQRLAGLPAANIRIVGTNALRSADNAADFLDR